MKVLLISDVHSNLEALEQVLNQTSFDEVLFAGDLVDYGPSPQEVIDVLLGYARPKRVLGNHDAAAAFRIDCRSSPATYAASVTTRKVVTWKLLSPKYLELLGKADRKLNLNYDGLKIRMLHAAPGNELFHYLTKQEAEQLHVVGADILVVGHTHIPYEVKKSNLWVVNPGSVGMPKDGDPRASYAILDTNKREVTFARVSYNIELMLSKLRGLLESEDKSTFEQLAKIFQSGK